MSLLNVTCDICAVQPMNKTRMKQILNFNTQEKHRKNLGLGSL